MNQQDILEQLKVLADARGEDADDLYRLPLSDLLLLTQGYLGAAQEHERTGLEQFIVWLNLAASIVGPAASIATGLLGVAKGVKALV